MGCRGKNLMPAPDIDLPQYLALRLHALDREDRFWILSRLGHEARNRLEPMLADLDNLGFRLDQATLETLRESIHGNVATSHAEVDSRNLALLRQVDSVWLSSRLKEEPQALKDCLAADFPLLNSGEPLPGAAGHSTTPPRLGPTPRAYSALLAALVDALAKEGIPSIRQVPSSDTLSGNSRKLWRWWPCQR